MTWVLTVVGLSVVVAVLVFLRLIEVTFIRLGRARASGLDESEGTSDRLTELVSNREKVLAPITALRVSLQVLIVLLVVAFVDERWGITGIAIQVMLGAAVLFVFGEALPRRWAIEANDRMAKLLVRPAQVLSSFKVLRLIVLPVNALASRLGPKYRAEQSSDLAEDELLAMAEAAAEARLMEDDEVDLIGSIIELGDTIAREIMVPRPDMVSLVADCSTIEALKIVVESGFTRLPVVGESIDDVLGVVLTKDLLAAHLSGEGASLVSKMLRQAVFVPESKRVVELMREMQASKSHMAIVVDEYGGTAGLISLEDIIEELVGEIVDEFDHEEPLVEKMRDGSLLLAGRVPIDELEELLEITLDGSGDWDTLGGLVFSLAGHVPKTGESVCFSGWEFTAHRIDGRRIRLIRAQRVLEGSM
jgi:CBS domain containing-hemolysin-like protein